MSIIAGKRESVLLIKEMSYIVGTSLVNVSNLKIAGPKIHLIYGTNCSGKTSFCNALVATHNQTLVYFNDKALTAGDIGYLSEAWHNYFDMTGRQLLFEYGGKFRDDRILEWSLRLELLLHQKIEGYSSSRRKLVEFLYVISHSRNVFVFDDLFKGLDGETCATIEGILQELALTSVVIITSNFLNAAAGLQRQVLMLRNNELCSLVDSQLLN